MISCQFHQSYTSSFNLSAKIPKAQKRLTTYSVRKQKWHSQNKACNKFKFLLSYNSIYDNLFLERRFMFSFNPNLALKMVNQRSYAHFCPNQGFKFRLSGQFTGSSGPESDSLKGPHELKQTQANICILSPMVQSLFLLLLLG